MWITISKIGAYLVSPLSLVLLFVIVGFLARASRLKRLGQGLVLFGLVLLMGFSLPPVAGWLVNNLESTYPPQPIENYEEVDTVVVLGGSIGMPYGHRFNVELTESSDRVLHGFRLLKAGKARQILLTGGNVDTETWQTSEASQIADLLQEWGVEPAQIEIEGESQTTYENAVNTARLLRQSTREGEAVILVTSAIHMPRSVAVFRGAGVNVIPSPTDITLVGVRHDGLFSWLPSIGALASSSRAFHEYVGLMVYWLRGWV